MMKGSKKLVALRHNQQKHKTLTLTHTRRHDSNAFKAIHANFNFDEFKNEIQPTENK